MNIEYRTVEMVREVREKFILHWNYRGFTELPEVMRNYGAHIQEAYLKWNRLSDLPFWIAELSSITNLYLHGNRIEILPDELGAITHLTTLDLGNNKLKTLPSCIGRLENLKILLLNENCMQILPLAISQLKKLETLSVSGNKLFALPEWLGSLPRLEELMADCNCLMELPTSLTLAPQLSAISVCSNRLQYLPLNGFLSAPCIQFDCNPSLNYLSVPVTYQLSRHNHCFRDARDIPAYRCSTEFVNKESDEKELNLSICLKVETTDVTSQEFVIVKLPRQLVVVHKICENHIPSLWELSLRQVYYDRFEHTLEIDSLSFDVKLKRTILRPQHTGSEITRHMSDLLNNGPTSICLRSDCQQPIFTEAWVHIDSDSKTTFLQLSLFCSKKCAWDFAAPTGALARRRSWCIV